MSEPEPKDVIVEQNLDSIRAHVEAGNVPATARELLLIVARAFLGIAEIGNSNRGYWIDKMESALGIQGLAWCMAYVQYVFRLTSDLLKRPDLLPCESPSTVKVFEWAKEKDLVVYLWSATAPGDIIIWRDGPKYQGHTGIIDSIDDSHMRTIEGNTSGGNMRDGGHVQLKTRGLGDFGQPGKPSSARYIAGFISLSKLMEAFWT